MDIVRGLKPLTDVERAFAAEKHRQLKAEIQLVCEMNPDLLDYPRGLTGNYVVSGKDGAGLSTSAKTRVCQNLLALRRAMDRRRTALALSGFARATPPSQQP